jgi:hypothetical protein
VGVDREGKGGEVWDGSYGVRRAGMGEGVSKRRDERFQMTFCVLRGVFACVCVKVRT